MEKLSEYLAFAYPGTLIFFILVFVVWYGLRLGLKRSTGLNILLFLALVLYFFSFYKNYAPFQLFMIFWFIRDALIVFVVYLLVKFTFKNKILATVVVIGTCGILGFWYYKKGALPFTSPEVAPFESVHSAELFVHVKDKNQLGELSKLLEPYQARIQQAFPHLVDTAITALDDYYTVDLINFEDTLAVIEKLEKSGLIHDVEYNETYTLWPVDLKELMPKQESVFPDSGILEIPDSTMIVEDQPMDYSGTSLNDPRIASIWGFSYMEIDKLMEFLKNAKPLKKAKIFILDTGVDATHEDLTGNYKSLAKEYDRDTDKHGTHCAGIANAVSNNNLGIASLNLTGKLTSVTSITVLPGGRGTQESIIDGIILAADNGADVISMSLGGPATDRRQNAYEKAIKYANDKGAIVVVAAGNENMNARFVIPASCKGVIAVSAVDDKLQKAVFSNFVTELEFKVSAPGVKILSTVPGNDYMFLNGTSMATPYVSGLIGILKAFLPKLTTDEAYLILSSTGKETSDTQMTGRFIQPLAALSSIETKSTQSVILGQIKKVFTFKPEKEE